jgi:hypothetical protein
MKFISLGSSCSIAENLRILNLRDQALPFDWIKVNNFKNVILMIEDNFSNLWDSNNYELVKTSSKFFYLEENLNKKYVEMDIYRNIKYNSVFYHDFPSNCENLYENFVKKYKKRCERFFNTIENNKSITFIREQINPKQISIDDLKMFHFLIKKVNSSLEFKLVIILNNFLNYDLVKLTNFCNSQKWIDLHLEESKIDTWQRFDIIKPIINLI